MDPQIAGSVALPRVSAQVEQRRHDCWIAFASSGDISADEAQDVVSVSVLAPYVAAAIAGVDRDQAKQRLVVFFAFKCDQQRVPRCGHLVGDHQAHKRFDQPIVQADAHGVCVRLGPFKIDQAWDHRVHQCVIAVVSLRDVLEGRRESMQ